MRSFTFIFRAVLIIVPIFLIFFFRAEAGDALNTPRSFMAGIFNRAFSYERFRELEAENLRLRLELAKLREVQGQEDPLYYENFDFIEAKVYSRYPWNGRGRVSINKGKVHGIEEGMVVMTDGNILFGKVDSVRNHQSEVVSIFDPSWRSSVSLGENGPKALLQGGNFPRLEFISSGAEIEEGVFVKNISPDFPFGLLVGKVSLFEENEFEPWLSADIEILWRINEVRDLMVLVNFP